MKKKIKNLLRLAAPYVVIILIPVISIICLGNMVLNSYHEKIIIDKQKNVNVAFERYLQRLDAVETLAYVISQSDVVTTYMSESNAGKVHTVIDCMEMSELLSTCWINNDVSEMYFYDINTNRIITPDNVLSDASEYFRLVYQLDGYTPQESLQRIHSFKRGCHLSPVLSGRLKRKTVQVIEYRISLPLNYDVKDVRGQLTFIMKIEDIFSDFYDIVGSQGEFYLYDSKDNLIFGNGNKYEFLLDMQEQKVIEIQDYDGKDIYGMVCHSDDNAWKVKVYWPKLGENENEKGMIPYVVLLMVFSIIICVVLCLYFTFKNHREISDVLNLFGEQDMEYNSEDVGYKSLGRLVHRLVNENSTFKEQIACYELSKKQEILKKLIHNVDESNEETDMSLEGIDISIKKSKCVVLCIRYDSVYYRVPVTEDGTVKDLVKMMVGELLERQFEIFDVSARETVCIIGGLEEFNTDIILREIVSKLKVEIGYNCGIEMEIAAGGIVETIYDISKSYKQAKEVLKHSEVLESEIYLYSDFEKLKSFCYYPKVYDEKICNYMAIGKVDEARHLIKEIYKENFEKDEKVLSLEAAEEIRSRLRNLIISFAKQYNISVESTLQQFDKEKDGYRYFEIFLAFMDDVSREIMRCREFQQNQSVLKIISYVDKNYCDNTLSLKQISQEFGYNETYVSSLFRKIYGEKFSVVVEKLRIQKACELLSATDMKVGDIAEAVGYTSDSSFRRAFKKVMNVAPGEYKDKTFEGGEA